MKIEFKNLEEMYERKKVFGLNIRRGASLTNIMMIVLLVLTFVVNVGVYAKHVTAISDENIKLSESTEYIDGRISIKYHKVNR